MKKKYRYYRFLYSAFALISLSLISVYNFSIKTIMLWHVTLPQIIAATTSIILSVCTMILFAKKFLLRFSGADIFFTKNKTSDLVQTGFYKYVRHPLYTATLVFVWSFFMLQPQLSNLISCVSITVYTIIGISLEEKKLVQHFGNSYIDYRNKTPMLIPKISL